MSEDPSVATLEEALDIARRFAPYALKQYPGAMVLLFGSYAKGCARANSDIDVAVLVERYPDDETPGDSWEKLRSLCLAAFDIDDRIQVVVRSLQDTSGFVATILETGIRVAGSLACVDACAGPGKVDLMSKTAFNPNIDSSERSGNADSPEPRRLSFLVDAGSYRWLEAESDRTGISLDKIASAVMRRACDEKVPVGAPDGSS